MSENRIKVTEIVKKIKKGNDNGFDGIQIKDYLPVSTKRLICEEIARNSIVEQDGMKVKDSIAFTIAFDLMIVQFYSNVDIDEHYDEACEYGIIDYIKDNMNQNEREFISEHSYYMIQNEINTYNSLSGVVSRNLQKLIDKLPDDKQIKKLVTDIPKQINKIKPEQLELIKEIIK